MNSNSLRLVRLAETCRKVGLKQSAVYAYMARGKFPKSIKITGKAVGWLEHELDAWITARVKTCRDLPAQALHKNEGGE